MLLLALLLLPVAVQADYAVTQTFSSPACAAGTETGTRTFSSGACLAAGVQSAKIDCSSRTTVYYSGNACAGTPSFTQPLPPSCSGRGTSYTGYSCVATPLTLPDTRTLGAVYALARYASCPASGAPTVADLSSALDVFSGLPAGCTAIPGSAGYAAAQGVCGPWGAGSTFFADAACKTPVGYSPLLTPANFSCVQSGGLALAYVCLDPVATAPTAPVATCKGAALPAPLATPHLTCYTGFVANTCDGSAALLPSSGYGVCAAATAKCSNAAVAALFSFCQGNPAATVRGYFGLPSNADVIASLSAYSLTDVSACTSSLCNALASDSCPIPVVACKGAVLPAPLAAPSLTCYVGLSYSGANVVAPSSGFSICAQYTARCSAAVVSGTAFCQNNPSATVRTSSGYASAAALAVMLSTPGVYDVSACTTALCNSPAADTCPITIATCKGAALPAPLATSTLTCYTGAVSSTGDNTLTTVSGVAICATATVSCRNAVVAGQLAFCQSNPFATVRGFFGLSSTIDIATVSSSGATDVAACTTPLCNALASDLCPISVITCKGAALPAPLAAPSLTCYVGLSYSGASVVAQSSSRSFGICAQYTARCTAAVVSGTAFCQSSPSATVRMSSGYASAAALADMLSTPGVYDVSACTTALCNSPAADTCPITIATCKGAALPAPLATQSLSCYGGLSFSGTTSVSPSSGFAVCAQFTAKCTAAAVAGLAFCQKSPSSAIRVFRGYYDSSELAAALATAGGYDISTCTTALCNSLAADLCPVPNTCKGATLPAPLATPTLTCYEGLSTYVSNAAAPKSGFGICAQYTASCSAAVVAELAFCQYSPTSTVRVSRGYVSAADLYYTLATSGVYDFSACTAALCNSPAADSCPISIATCKGAALPASLATPSLTCYVGVVTGTGSSITYLTPSSGFGVCGAATATCSHPVAAGLPFCKGTPTATVRFYFGLGATADISPYLASGATDFFACTTALCNAPSSDTCAIAAAPAYTPLSCAARGALSTAVSAAPIACYSNLATGGVGAPVLQAAAVPGATFCVATTVNCAGASAARLKAACGSSKATLRVYSDNAALSLLMDGPMLSSLYPPAAEYHQYFGELLLCSTAGCNAPAADACALAPAPVLAYASFSSLPASAQDAATGKLSASGLAAVQAAVSAGVAASACSTCIATVTRATDASSGAAVYGAARRLALDVKVTFDLNGRLCHQAH